MKIDRTKEWMACNRDPMLIKDMEDSHINNTILYIQKELEEVSKDRKYWHKQLKIFLKAMEKELKKRKLPAPLLPFITLEYRRKHLNQQRN